MRINFGAKAILYPMPVLIICSYDENGIPSALMQCLNYKEKQIYGLSLRNKCDYWG